jgi:deoxyribose-phosphate aldolase
MTNNQFDDNGFVIDNPNRELMAHTTIMHRLALEINTGLKASGGVSTLKAAQDWEFTDKRTKKAALRQMVEIRKAGQPGWEPSDSIVRALAK